MPAWKKSIFVNAIKFRTKDENRMPEDVIKDYPRLTENEQKEILEEINKSVEL